jgi:hypothetical protein
VTLRAAIILLMMVCGGLAVVALITGAPLTTSVGALVTVAIAGVGLFGGRRRDSTCGAVPPPSFGSDRREWRCTRERRHRGDHHYYRRAAA